MTTTDEELAYTVAGHTLPCRVFVLTAGRSRAVCECGWAGHKRLSEAGARVDAWLHATQSGHMPATPLALNLTEVVDSLGSGWTEGKGPANDQSPSAGWSADNPGVGRPQNGEETRDLSG